MTKENTGSKVLFVVDLGFGDSGKGTIVDSLVRRYNAHTVVRYNGGAQAAHNVITPDGRHHTFAQFGSGMFVPGVKTFLSRFMLVNPKSMLVENNVLAQKGIYDAFERTLIDENALVITPFHIAANRMIEHMSGPMRNGSCGQGIGQTVSDSLIENGKYALRVKDLLDLPALAKKLYEIQAMKQKQAECWQMDMRNFAAIEAETHILYGKDSVADLLPVYAEFAESAKIVPSSELTRILSSPGVTVFEGAQGVLLDPEYGFFPHVTRTTTTLANAYELLKDAEFKGDILRIGVVRTYMTRHGAGPFVTEDRYLTTTLRDAHNVFGPWQEGFRVGWFDAIAVRYAIEACGQIDCLAVTHLDRLSEIGYPIKTCVRYHYQCMPISFSPSHFFDIQHTSRKFSGHTGFVWGIKLKPEGRHSKDALKRYLAYVRPVYESSGFITPDGYAKFLGGMLGVNIGIVSSGPTALSKRYMPLMDKFINGAVN